MSIEAKKIEIIEAVLQMQDEEILASLITNIHSSYQGELKKNMNTILSVAGTLSVEDAEEMKQIIEEHFEKTDLNDWK